jgi:dCTP deaminase
MILSGEEIRQRLDGDISIDPFHPAQLNPNSYNLTLHDELLVYEEVVLDIREPNRYRRIQIPSEGLVLSPIRSTWVALWSTLRRTT